MKPDRDSLICYFLKFGVMLANGVPMLSALENLGEAEKDAALMAATKHLSNYVAQGGIDLAAAMTDFPDVFDPRVIALTAAGQQAGAVDLVFRSIAEYLVYDGLNAWKRQRCSDGSDAPRVGSRE